MADKKPFRIRRHITTLTQYGILMFLWGSATSSFQIEGNIKNDFTDYEQKLGYPPYEEGSNHWKMWKDDIDMIRQLNQNAYRFSIEWSRLQPEPNTVSLEALNRYDATVDRLLEKGIEPMITLHHFAHPYWFHDVSPWHTGDSVKRFLDYSDLIFSRLADRVKYWITFNEPVVWSLAAYADAKFPPALSDLNLTMKALFNMMKAHAGAYEILKSYNSESYVGIAKHFIIFKEAREWFYPDKSIARRIDNFFNFMLLDAFITNRITVNFPPLLKFDKPINLNNKIDFWGINYYYRLHTKFKLNLKNPFLLYVKDPATDTGWEIYPKGLKKIIKLVSRYNKEIIITENGIATGNDLVRKKFIKKHVKIVRKQLEKGYKIKGYFYWSLMDNYEWLHGKSKRFGLVEVDYENNYKRTIRPSGHYYAGLIEKFFHDRKRGKINEKKSTGA
ncbi:MAG: glycoside hydrolase family 1 protein [Melioribacter sp.]|uniref:glycoside hydrolase family 1 protein n=1 Tax=Melioribacter sp. TaxID=2052167 RepID=UPI003BD22C82